MKKILLGILPLILVSSLVFAQANPQQSLQKALEQIAKFFPNDIIHVQISSVDTSLSFTVTTSGGQVTDFKEGAPSNPTLIISTSQPVLEKIYSSSDQTAATIQALNSGGITITPVGILNQVKTFFFKIFTTIYGLFVKG